MSITANNGFNFFASLRYKVGRIGLSKNELSFFKYSKGVAFNYMNVAGLVVAIVRLSYILFHYPDHFTLTDVFANILPVACGLLMMGLMYRKAFITTVWVSFLGFPTIMLAMYLLTSDWGILFYLLPYLVYPFFFLNSKRKIIFTFLLSALILGCCLLRESILHDQGPRSSKHTHYFPLDLISFVGCMILLFISLYYIKFQVWQYQGRLYEQRKELEARQADIEVQKEKLQESNFVKDKLFSILSHDLKTSVYGIQLLLSKEKGAGKSMELLYEHLPTISNEVNNMADLFNNLVNWSKLQLQEAEIRIEKIDIEALARKVTATLNNNAREKGVIVTTELSNTHIYADASIMEIVLRNLVSNAIKFTHRDDTIVIRGKSFFDSYQLEVADHGVGITTDAMEKILSNSFYTTSGTQNEKGTGLGLIICRDLIEKCNGDFTITSQLGKGTIVSICLPQE
jgi:two-component system, sensor histidine kinase and response regulator